MTEQEKKEQDFLKGALKLGLRIQHRFVPEPLYARTGVGYLKSEGVEVLQRAKASIARSNARKAARLVLEAA